MKSVLPVATVVVGVILLVAGFMWGNLFPPAAAWTPEQNTRLTDLGTELKGLGFRLAEAEANPQTQGEKVNELRIKHDEVKKEFDALYAEFESARDRPASTGRTLKWLGIIVAVGGALFVFANRQEG